ncbi:uncharacterized protein LAESUDRAFT_644568 [Laetiporus sulphureus 93-53]|uniref:CHAT domain-containing protein n=1 Tax=Laetiporus sulphureus 93-53 TaxID=1314785 RepID=A0A165GKX9_9APHY|nr:uncharacterized protein LAESUDRAFT_644568 [Laetiporus sulphureus 93-53]KZT10493.1 hypothetical protein LAESUDRAFT_644568 [Laetiporus sulphureus 93-53]
MSDLSQELLKCYHKSHLLSELKKVVIIGRIALQLASNGHEHKLIYCSILAYALQTQFHHTNDLTYLDQTIALQKDAQKAVQLTPDDHADKPDYLNKLGNSFFSRFKHLHNLTDVDQAIAVQQKAVQLTSNYHAKKPGYLNNLGNFFRSRFENHDNIADVDRAIAMQQAAVQLISDGHAHKPAYLLNLGYTLSSCFKSFNDISVFEKAIVQFSSAAQSSTGSLYVRFTAGYHWIHCAYTLQHSSLFRACDITFSLLLKLAWLRFPISYHFTALNQLANLAKNAAAIAIQCKRYDLAVEWLEQGRSIVWGQQLQLRHLQHLQSMHPTLADKLEQILKQLEQASYRLDMKKTVQMSLGKQAQQHHALAHEWELLLAEVQSMPGFEQFLTTKKLPQLLQCAHSGPVVILNCSQWHCDALIILPDSKEVVHLPLNGLTYQIAQNLAPDHTIFTATARDVRTATMMFVDDVLYSSFESILSQLWYNIVKPVLDKLAYPKQTATCSNLSRIFWCPTGSLTFLPIHAAGIYGRAESNVKISEFVISSYTPTLSALILPTEDNTPQNIHLLALAQPSSDGLSRLPGTQEEIFKIKERLTRLNSMQIVLVESDGTKDHVLHNLYKCSWAHFACHGIQDLKDPLDSGLQLANNQRLKLSDIIKTRHPHGGLAFLSACETATGDKKLADEAVHLAAGMLFIGYNGVIATMWSILDSVAPQVAQGVYSQLLSDDSPPDHRQAARALHYAVEQLQQDPNMSFYSWLPFIHLGL